MTFENNLNLLLKKGFYLVRIWSLTDNDPNNFGVVIGSEGRLYKGEGKSLDEGLAEALVNFRNNIPWPEVSVRNEGGIETFLTELGLGK